MATDYPSDVVWEACSIDKFNQMNSDVGSMSLVSGSMDFYILMSFLATEIVRSNLFLPWPRHSQVIFKAFL